MNNFNLASVVLIIAVGSPVMAQKLEVEQAHARATAVAMTASVDVQDWAEVESYFLPVVTVDYTSLFPGKVEILPRETLVGRWKALVPGFEATRHLLSDVEVEINKNEAIGSAKIVAAHWLSGESWEVAGRYKYVFRKTEDGWKISELTYLNEVEKGNRDLVERATAIAAKK